MTEKKYNFAEIEKKWKKKWNALKTYKVDNNSSKKKFYVLDMFPYPSGAGLHVGHPKGYTANDIVARYMTAKGYNVLHPMGWDAFGLPAENYAIKTGTHPKKTTLENISVFKKQIQDLGFSYDWDREIDTTDPKYYKWTQWIFLKLFEAGLAYEQDLPINYCPKDKTGLANEEVIDGCCDRCGTKVERRKIRQWVLAITKYADRLYDDVDKLDWPEGIKEMQKNWIGRSIGTEFSFEKSDDSSKKVSVYTTRIDTVFGVTYVVMAPDHPQVTDFISADQRSTCQAYIENTTKKSDLERTELNKDKTGVFTGSYVINPFNGEKVPLWIADYVLGSYGTGAVMAVPAHDERDFEFATKYNLPIKQSVSQHFVLEGSLTPKNNVETLNRKIIDAIIENEKGEFLMEVEKNGDEVYYKFVGGGIEEGDTELETVSKEIIEETGYTNIIDIQPINMTYLSAVGFRHTKNKNQFTIGRWFHVKINSDTQIASEIEQGQHSVVWVKKEEVENLINWVHHKKIWQTFTSGQQALTEKGILVNSGEYSGKTSEEAIPLMQVWLEQQGIGGKKVNYKLRDWLFSRQRYWGEPIPLIHINIDDYDKLYVAQNGGLHHNLLVGEAFIDRNIKENGEFDDTLCIVRHISDNSYSFDKISKVYDGVYTKIVCDYNLPLELPEVQNYEPAGDGKSPLATIDSFVNVELASNLRGQRETNTMPQWGGSCWYYLRFMDPHNDEELASKEALKYWGQVDSYVGGAEHAVLHLLYARFWHKFLFDIGVVPHDEPFQRLRNQGLIQAFVYMRKDGGLVANDLVDERNDKFFHKETGEELTKSIGKMSKSLKNVENPDDYIKSYGADILRMFEMSLGDFKDNAPWNTASIIGLVRFLDKVWNSFENNSNPAKDDTTSMKLLHRSIKKVGQDIENYKYNTSISQLMILLNSGIPQNSKLQKEWKESFLIMLGCYAPFIAEELWENLGHNESIFHASWPAYEESMLVDDVVEFAIQIAGKMRGTVQASPNAEQDEVLKLVQDSSVGQKYLEGVTIKKIIFVRGKLINIIV